MKIRDTRPVDFAAFWNQCKTELGSVQMNPEVGTFKTFKGKEIDAYNLANAGIPGDYDPHGHKTEEVEAAKVSFAGAQGRRVYAWLAKPAGKGPFPAMLVLPGAGFGARPIPLEHARHGYIALDIQVHGQDVDQEEYPAIPGYYDHFVYEPIQAHYFSHVYLNALQAVSYLASRPDVDQKQIVVAGGSQGGRLSIVVACLDHRIAAAVPAITHNANVVYTQWATASNLAGDDGTKLELPPAPADTPEQKCLPYYDVINFAPEIRCPMLMNAGLIDPVSPPTGVFAVYQRLGTRDKTLVPLPGMGHDWSAEFDRRAWRWLEEKLQ
jgi:cephalosporin-C deacetylase-like acetyl esterase